MKAKATDQTAHQAINQELPRVLTSARGVRAPIDYMKVFKAGAESADTQSVRASSASIGTFDAHTFTNVAGSRSYKLYVPARRLHQASPMVVMLHGCSQSADDFATGTQMNGLAEEHGLLVVYPEQATQANPMRCWNWFKAEDQLRDAGEPSLIAGIVGEVAARHSADRRRIFIAGLSAGAAMAVVLGRTYPELFAGVGAHSGLPYGSAYDAFSAMSAMMGGRAERPGGGSTPGAIEGFDSRAHAMPVIVFHGDGDRTVQATNGAGIIQQATVAHLARTDGVVLSSTTHEATVLGGRSYSRIVHADAIGQSYIESWLVRGGGHAWSGGSGAGSFTDAAGPDASAEMIRFFLALPCNDSAPHWSNGWQS